MNKSYPEAEAAFQRVVDKYPQSRKLADALLKIGFCRYETKQWHPPAKCSAKWSRDLRIRPRRAWRNNDWIRCRPRNIE